MSCEYIVFDKVNETFHEIMAWAEGSPVVVDLGLVGLGERFIIVNRHFGETVDE